MYVFTNYLLGFNAYTKQCTLHDDIMNLPGFWSQWHHWVVGSEYSDKSVPSVSSVTAAFSCLLEAGEDSKPEGLRLQFAASAEGLYHEEQNVDSKYAPFQGILIKLASQK